MKLTAMLIARNEAQRFLNWTLPALNEFCDEVRVICDDSTDGTHTILAQHGCIVKRNDGPEFFKHEGRARNQLLDWALQGQPTHLLAIDCDEIVEDGQAVRDAIENRTSASGVWNLAMTEIWKADKAHLYERVDGQWGARKVPMLFEVPARITSAFRIADRALACGREPMVVAKQSMRGRAPTVCPVFHFGWTCETDREHRYERYVKHDGGQFHASAHLQSIMFPDEQVGLRPLLWPASLENTRNGLLTRINQ